MSMASQNLKLIAEQARSASADKLALLCITAESAIQTSPKIAERISSFELSWQKLEGVLLPCVKMTFANEPE
ncbi:hypothetical protein MZD04_gp227 [Pseudomonas phage Psa21]|uniref:Uncharacterized protein n=1 Tax=Pseudomonas phage Psa21 TaxID=2530023 RepID=A0A481W5U5_9CAUD|nr:hypothetical protein MZD04_gp227 [Pseudomonas phage Psa21]QBJ02753.1 hypothetical protein PSA21_227 [Pseudomonas phage Psa21]